MAKTKDGFYKDYGILSDNYILLAAGGHKKYGNETDDIPVSNGTMNVDLFAEYAQKVKPLYEQTYIHTCTSNDDANGYIFFGNVKPTSGYWQEPWEIYYTLVVNTPNANCQGVYDVIMSAAGSTLIYHIYNRFYSGSYRPIYHHVLLWHDSQTRYNNRATYPAKIGVRVRDAYNVTSLQRTYNIKVWKLTNCEFEFPSNVELRGSVYNTTNYALTQLNGTDFGLQETGDTYDTTTMQLAYSRLQAGANGIKQYSLIMQDGTGKWQSFTSGSGTGTSKAKNTNGFRLGSRIYYVNRGSDLAANGYLDNSNVRTYQALIDFRYTLNITANSLGNGLTYNKPIFIVGKINETDGLFYLNDTWWTQDEPTSEDGNIYIRVAEAVYPDYNISSMPTGNYRADFLSDGYAFYYTEGKIKKYGSGDSNYRLYIGVGNAASSALVTNPYIKLFCSTKLKDQYQIIGSGATSVQSANNGNITISSTDNKVTQTLIDSSNTNSRPLIIGYSSSNANPRSFASTTNTVYATYNMYVDPTDGRLTLYALNNLFVGTGTAATTSGSNYIPAKWTFNKGIIPKDGDIFTIKIPVNGHDYGVFISLNNGTNYYPVVLNGTGRLTSHYPAGTYLLVAFEEGGQANSVFPVAGGTSRTNVSGGAFRVLNYYDTTDTTNMYLPYSQLKAGTSGIKENSLVMQAGDGTWQSFTTTNGTGTSKAKNTTGFRLGSRIYYTSNGNIAANSNMGTWVLRAYVANIDFRYSTNCGTTLTAKKPLYIVGTINTSNGLFYLDDTWWTQTEPTSANGKIYIRVCEAAYDTYRGDLVSDGYAFWFKNGKFQRYGLGTAEDIPKALVSKGTTATSTAGEVYGISGNTASGSRIPTRWFVNLDNGDKTLKDGMIISFRLPTAGLDTVGECITIDGNQQNFHQVVYNTNSKLTTHFGVNSVITLQYDATISCDMYGKFDSSTSTYVQNGNNTTSVTGVWRLLTLYNSGGDDTKVTQTATTTDANYEILFSATADNTTRTETARKTSTLLYNPSSKLLSNAGIIQGTQLKSTIATGTSPLIITSTTKVDNLNVDMLDGYHEGSFFRYRGAIDVNYVDLTTYTANAANYQNPLNGIYYVSRTGHSAALIAFTGSGSSSGLDIYFEYTRGQDFKFRRRIDSNRLSGDWETIITNVNISPSLLISGNTIAVQAGGVTSSYITVPYASNTDMLDGVHLNGIFTAFSGGGISSSNNTLTQENHSITIGGVTKTAGSSTATIINSLSISTLTSNSTTNLNAAITINGKASSATAITDLYSRYAEKLYNTSANNSNTCADGQYVRWYAQISSTTGGSTGYAGNNYGFPVSNNANGILWLGTHSGPYGGQIGISSNGNIYYRYISSNTFPTTADGGSWKKILDTVNTYISNGKGYINGVEITQVNNADTVDDVHATGFFRYEGWWTSGSGQNIDDAEGMTFVYSNHGSPHGWGVLSTFSYQRGSSYKIQLFSDGYNDGYTYYRNKSSDRGGWGDWIRFIDSKNYTEYVNPKATSKTIWGQTYIDTNGNFQNVNGLIKITANSKTLTIGANNSSWYHFSGSDSSAFYFSNSSSFNGNVSPYTNNTYTLGTTSNRWKNVYIGTANSYGSATNPIYWNDGIPKACDYSLNATVNSGVANRIAWYNTATSITYGTITTDGAYLGSVSYLSINTEHQTSYRLYVNGTSYFANNGYFTAGQNNGLNVASMQLRSASNTDLEILGGQIRFSNSTSWDWNQWAGLRYDNGNKIIYLGLADKSVFTANSAVTGGSLRLPSIEYISFNNNTPFYNNSGSTTTSTHNANDMYYSGHWYYTSNGPSNTILNVCNGGIAMTTGDASLYSQAYNTSWVSQIAQDYRNGRLFVRSRNNGTWMPWLNVINNKSHYGTTGSNSYYKISINSYTSWMLTFTIRIYQGYTMHDIIISGYNYGANHWYSPTAILRSSTAESFGPIYFGYDSNYHLWVTVPGGSYTGIDILECTNGYTQTNLTLQELFTITPVSSVPSTQQTSTTAWAPAYGRYWANLNIQIEASNTTVPSFGAIRMNGVTSAGTNYITGTAGRIYFGGNFHIDSLGSNATYINYYTANNIYMVSGSSQGNVGIGTSSPDTKLDVRGTVSIRPNANTTSSTTWTWCGGGYYSTANPNIRLIGDNDHGISTIEFVSQKGDTSINKPSDCAFIQFNPYGISALSAIASQPTLATSGEINRLIIGVNNDSNDQLWLQTPGVDGLRHIVGTNNYRILTSQNTYVSNGKGYINDTEITTINHSSTVTVNNSDANSTYRMVWHSGNTLYSTNNIYCNPSSDTIYNNGTFANIGNSNSSGGLSLYGTDYTYGVVFRGTGTGSNWGTHGGVTSDWATYFTMNDNTARGWIFRRGSTNVASIDGNGRIYVGAVTSSANPGLYWNPYVESSSDGSDAAGIWQIKSGVAGGSELRISQQNDSTDVINICAPYYIYFNSKRAFTINDSWLRINENLGFSSGIYTGSSLVRSDNQLQVGSSGSAFYANSSGNGYFSNTLGIAGTNTGYKLYVNGSGYFTGHVNSYGFHHLSHNNNDAVLLAGGGWSYINSLLPTSIDNWQSRVGNTITITVTGDSNKYYPVKIAATRSKTSKNYVSIWKDLGSQTASYSGNHSNGTSSCWYIFEGRYNGWDGNGGYWLTYKAWYGYARLLVHAEAPGNAMGDLIVWLRGGGTLYYISTTYPSSASIYYSTTNATGSSQYTYNVSPRTESTSGNNWGILRYTYIANIDGTATYSTYANNVYVTQNISSNADYPLIWTNQNNTKSAWGQQLHKSYDYLLYNPSTKVLRNDGPLWLRPDRDATIKIYSGKITDGYSDGFICMQTSIDGTDGQSHSHPTNYGARCVIALQPRGGEVYVGKTITAASTSADTTYKLNVGGNVNADGNLWVRGSGVYLRIGPQNGTYAHYETNASTSHWFNKRIDVDGDIRLYNGTAWIQSSNGHMYSNGFHHRSINSDNYVLLAGGSYKEWSTSSKANTIVARDANQYIYATYYNSNISDENSITIGSVYVRNNSDNWIRRMSFTNFINRIRESEIYTVTKSLKVGKAWINTGIDGTNTNLTTGVYVVCIWNVNNSNQGVYNYSEYYAGIMSWFNGTTNSTDSEEILLHNAGHAPNEHHLYLRTLRRSGTVTGGLLLQIACDVDSSAATDYVFKFRRLI